MSNLKTVKSSRLSIKQRSKVEDYNKYLENNMKKFLDFSFKIGELDITADLYEELLINPDVPADITSGMAKSPARFAYWKALREEVMGYKAKERLKFDVWFNELFIGIATDAGHKRDTDSRISRLIYADHVKEYKIWMTALQEIDRIEGKLKIAIDAYERKMDMLRSIGAMVRTEMSNQPGL